MSPFVLILIADDDPDMRAYLTSCLTTPERRIVAAADGREALRLARALRPALVVSDVVMPGLDGPALCHALRADLSLAATPLLLISGESRAPPACADGFLAKPFNAASLRLSVDRLLSSSHPPPS